MSKTTNVITMQEKLARLNERTKSTEAELKRLGKNARKFRIRLLRRKEKSEHIIFVGLEVLFTNTSGMIFLPKNLRRC